MEVVSDKINCLVDSKKGQSWLDKELESCEFEDKRLEKIFKMICE
jgi:hypothetical protein